jgi:hypothetical protein
MIAKTYNCGHALFERHYVLFQLVDHIIGRHSCSIEREMLTPAYTEDFPFNFRCDFLLLNDVKELISYNCSKIRNLITTLLSNLLLHIVQKENIPPIIAAKIAGLEPSLC